MPQDVMPQDNAIERYSKIFPYRIRVTGADACGQGTQWCLKNMNGVRFNFLCSGTPDKDDWAACVEYSMKNKFFFFCDGTKAIEFRLMFG